MNPADPALAAIVAHVESNDRLDALRYEPGFAANLSLQHPVVKSIALVNLCTLETARVIASSSWGKYQVLGCNVYDLGYTETIADFWQSAGDQDRVFAAFLEKHAIAYSWEELVEDMRDHKDGELSKAWKFVTTYNGPGGWPVYWQRMLQAAGVVPAVDPPGA